MAGGQGWERLTFHGKCVFVVCEYFNKWIHFLREKRPKHLPLLFFVLCYVNEENSFSRDVGRGGVGRDATGNGKYGGGVSGKHIH